MECGSNLVVASARFVSWEFGFVEIQTTTCPDRRTMLVEIGAFARWVVVSSTCQLEDVGFVEIQTTTCPGQTTMLAEIEAFASFVVVASLTSQLKDVEFVG